MSDLIGLSPSTVEEHFNVAGGILRYYLRELKQVKQLIDSAFSKSGIKELLECRTRFEDVPQVLALIHLIPTNKQYSEVLVNWASKYVEQSLPEQLEKIEVSNLVDYMVEFHEVPWGVTAYGKVYEAFCRKCLPAGGTFTLLPLDIPAKLQGC